MRQKLEEQYLGVGRPCRAVAAALHLNFEQRQTRTVR